MVTEAIERLLRSLQLDELGEARAAIARTLAQKMDQLASDEHTGSGVAMAGAAKELREVVEAIVDARAADDAFVADLFAAVGDAKAS